MNRASGTCSTTINDLFISSEFQKEKDKRWKLKKVLNFPNLPKDINLQIQGVE